MHFCLTLDFAATAEDYTKRKLKHQLGPLWTIFTSFSVNVLDHAVKLLTLYHIFA